jgi:hypothetical protein
VTFSARAFGSALVWLIPHLASGHSKPPTFKTLNIARTHVFGRSIGLAGVSSPGTDERPTVYRSLRQLAKRAIRRYLFRDMMGLQRVYSTSAIWQWPNAVYALAREVLRPQHRLNPEAGCAGLFLADPGRGGSPCPRVVSTARCSRATRSRI